MDDYVSKKVMLIGRSGVGKTTNLACAYGLIHDKEGVYSKRHIHFESEELRKIYNRYVLSTEDPGSNRRSKVRNIEINLKGIFKEQSIINMKVYDIKGRAAEDGRGSDNWNRILAESIDADYILAYFACDELLPTNKRAYDYYSRYLDSILDLINDRIQYGKRGFDLILVFTKVDRISSIKDAREEILNLFHDLIDAQIPGTSVYNFFVSNKQNEIETPELPLMAVVTKELVRKLSECPEDRISKIKHYNESRCARWLCKRLSTNSGDGRWVLMTTTF